MREHLGHVTTIITVSKDNTLRVTLTEANHAHVEATDDGWLYRGNRVKYSIHTTFNGKEWVQQDLRGSVHCPNASDKGEKIITGQVLSALNAAVLRTDWFERLRHEAEAHSTNNDLVRVENQITEMEQQLTTLKARRAVLLTREVNAKRGIVPAFYSEPTPR